MISLILHIDDDDDDDDEDDVENSFNKKLYIRIND